MNYIDYSKKRTKSGELEMDFAPLYIIGSSKKPRKNWLLRGWIVVMIALPVAVYCGLVMRGVL